MNDALLSYSSRLVWYDPVFALRFTADQIKPLGGSVFDRNTSGIDRPALVHHLSVLRRSVFTIESQLCVDDKAAALDVVSGEWSCDLRSLVIDNPFSALSIAAGHLSDDSPLTADQKFWVCSQIFDCVDQIEKSYLFLDSGWPQP